ncbi:MAG TPA: tetratricopeptide repeat protein [Candidatus Ozemobacteraceae bacterium]|nr:tetratricopeptide repeat protein [Candidatus Ozemobacteraceae bacterium]
MTRDESERTTRALDKFQHGIDLDAEGKTEEAIESYREAVEICPELPQAYYNLGVDLAMKGQSDQAIRAWRRAVWLKSDYRYELMNAFDIDHETRETEIMPCSCPALRAPRHETEDRY